MPIVSKVSLRRVYLDSGGYDSHGAYFGAGQPLYCAVSDDGNIDIVFRAGDRVHAKAKVRDHYPDARFYR